MRFELRIAGEVSVEEGTHKSAKSERWLIAKSENSLPLPSTCYANSPLREGSEKSQSKRQEAKSERNKRTTKRETR